MKPIRRRRSLVLGAGCRVDDRGGRMPAAGGRGEARDGRPDAAVNEFGMDGARETCAIFFNQTLNRGRLQRAERLSENDPYPLPLPRDAGGPFGQSAVYTGEVTYDPESDEWSVTDDRFYTSPALYLSNQEIWIGQWGGSFFPGNGFPGRSDEPPA